MVKWQKGRIDIKLSSSLSVTFHCCPLFLSIKHCPWSVVALVNRPLEQSEQLGAYKCLSEVISKSSLSKVSPTIEIKLLFLARSMSDGMSEEMHILKPAIKVRCSLAMLMETCPSRLEGTHAYT